MKKPLNDLEDFNQLIPNYLYEWFEQKGWVMHCYQQKMFDYFASKQSVLLIAPTGGGKTLASFLPSLIDLTKHPFKGLHTLYISPLKALTQDIFRNLIQPIAEMGLDIQVSTRTGDTSSYQRQKQLKKPPHILLTTPESLMLLLSYPHSEKFFKDLKVIIVDEIHSFATSKRGDLTSLAMAQLNSFAPKAMRIGLSATIGNPKLFTKWLAPSGEAAELLYVPTTNKPIIHLLGQTNIPYCGYKAKHAIQDIYHTIQQHNMTIIFVNTRANTEFLFRQLWLINKDNIPIAIYHGSISKEQRLKTEALTVAGELKAIVATSALELGIDWGNGFVS